jgi:aryl-alcohol dehydrogenase-like predicted oxidoreductase
VKERTLGKGGLRTSAIGLGCMSMSEFYGDVEPDRAERTLLGALDLGVRFLDTAEMYGMGRNEELIGRVLKGRFDEFAIATKFGPLRDPKTGMPTGIDGSPANAQRACEGSLQRLGVDAIDLYYLHRVDPAIPIEESVGGMADLVKQGKVRHLGLSEASAATLHRAAVVHPIAAVQTEYSLFSRDPERGILAACRETGTGFVAYSPLGRGLLTGRIRSAADLAGESDFRRAMQPRFADENLDDNLALVREIEAVAETRGCTPAQVALAWLLAQGDDVVPIPGTTRLENLEQNVGALDVVLDGGDLERLSALAARVAGARYDERGMAVIDAETPGS